MQNHRKKKLGIVEPKVLEHVTLRMLGRKIAISFVEFYSSIELNYGSKAKKSHTQAVDEHHKIGVRDILEQNQTSRACVF